MFQFITTTLLNSGVDTTTKLPKWTVADDVLRIKRVGNFVKDNIVSIFKRSYSAPVLSRAELNINSITQASGNFRIAMYIRLSGNQNSLYSNDMVFKGKPLYIEFEKKVGETSTQVASKIVEQVKKYQRAYNFKYVNISSVGTRVLIEAVDEYQRFTKVDIEYFDADAGTNAAGAFTVIHSAMEVTADGFDNVNVVVQGREGFGTYQHIIKDLRIPTLDVNRFASPHQEEAPIINGHYTQYTLTYKKDRGIMGGDVVGQTTTSQTTHVFYVHDSIVASFEAALGEVGSVVSQDKPVTLVSPPSTTNATLVSAGTATTISPSISGSTIARVTATSDEDWIVVTPGITNVSVGATANTGAARSAEVTLIVTAANGVSVTGTITVTQSAA